MHKIKIIDLMKNEMKSVTYFINTSFNMTGIDIPEKTDTDFSNIMNALSQYYGMNLNMDAIQSVGNYDFCSFSFFHMSGSNVDFEEKIEEKIRECKPFKTLFVNTDNTTEIGEYTLKGVFMILTASEIRSAIIHNDEGSAIYFITK